VAVKKATILMNQAFTREGLEVKQVAHVHDEVQFECAPDIADKVGGLAVTAIQEAGLFFNFRCPLDGEYSIGNNWYETH
jgi:DNA polymerase I-like protein with 3'-5' exonuclease and polymerase domains